MTHVAVIAAQRHALVQVQGLDVVWHTMTGGGLEVETTPDPDGARGEVLTGSVTATDITLTTGFSPHHDLDWVRDIKRGVGTARYTVVRQWTDENWSPIGTPEVYPGCLLVGYTNPTTAPSSEAAQFSITLATTGEAL